MDNRFTKSLLQLFFFSALSLQSCATIFTGTKDTITINTQPQGAKVQVDGIDKGTTPCTVTLKRGSDATVSLKKDGYQVRMFQPETTFNAISIINLTNLLGWGIDAISGAIKKYDPKVYDLQLEPAPAKQPIP